MMVKSHLFVESGYDGSMQRNNYALDHPQYCTKTDRRHEIVLRLHKKRVTVCLPLRYPLVVGVGARYYDDRYFDLSHPGSGVAIATPSSKGYSIAIIVHMIVLNDDDDDDDDD